LLRTARRKFTDVEVWNIISLVRKKISGSHRDRRKIFLNLIYRLVTDPTLVLASCSSLFCVSLSSCSLEGKRAFSLSRAIFTNASIEYVTVPVFYFLLHRSIHINRTMGQAIRMMKYDSAGNMANAVPTSLSLNNAKLIFHRLDDGVMGGKSITNQAVMHSTITNGLLFSGTIDTNGGGFTSIRSPLDNALSADAKGIKLRYKGDGKTYKILLSEGNGAGGPFSQTPSWQADLATRADEVEETIVEFNLFKPSFGGRGASRNEMESFVFDQTKMSQMGLMLSLKLSNGDKNPVETFGEGIFDFRFELHEVDLV